MSVEQLGQALASNYVLVNLEMRKPGFRKADKEASDEVTTNKQAIRGAARVNTNILAGADHEVEEIKRLQGALYTYVMRETLPWSTAEEGRKHGYRLLATAKAMNFIRDTSELKKHCDDAVLALQRVWPQRVAQAKQNLQGLDKHEYADAADIPALFGIRVDVQPIAAVHDFSRLTLPAELADALAAQHQARAETQVRVAMDDLRGRFTEELERFATQLGKKASGEKGAKLFDTLITNMQGLVGMARSMNVTNNPKLEELANRIEARLLQLPLEAYKEDTAKAAVAASDAKELQTIAAIDDVWEQL